MQRDQIAEETISGVRTVRSFSKEKYEKARYHSALDTALTAIKKRTLSVSWFQAIMSFIGYGAIAVVLWLGGRLVTQGEMSVGELTSFMAIQKKYNLYLLEMNS